MTTGTVQEKITADKEVDGQTISASQSHPRYLVKNDSSGKVTSHALEALSEVDADTAAQAKSAQPQRSSKPAKSSGGNGSSENHPKKKNQGKDGANSVEVGDRVEWESRQGKTTGKVQEKLTETTQIKSHTAKATEDNPQYLVKSDRTGSEAAHKPKALKPTSIKTG
jgi:hypothetical protein